MSIAYTFTLDGTAFSDYGKFARGPIEYVQPQRWAQADALGATGTDATIIQFVGLKSQTWTFEPRCNATEKNKLKSVYTGRAAVVLKTPQDSTGINVVMTDLQIQYTEPIEGSRFLCKFTLVQR